MNLEPHKLAARGNEQPGAVVKSHAFHPLHTRNGQPKQSFWVSVKHLSYKSVAVLSLGLYPNGVDRIEKPTCLGSAFLFPYRAGLFTNENRG
ncbi:hypothetical protein VF11_37560 [Nostoc linckia z14]|nr:hypothetical protein VF11_37560 [Nostoc linckia z14]PHK14295.1 hypothetical protein VF12_40990 [Nostoc linckia z15]